MQLTSLTGQVAIGPGSNGQSQMGSGLQPWSKAGIIIKENTSQGSAYAAMMVTGSNGVRMQWDYVNDRPGLPGSVSASAPRWLRLVRDGDTITGYDSADGTHWTPVGTVTLPGLTTPKPDRASRPLHRRPFRPASRMPPRPRASSSTSGCPGPRPDGRPPTWAAPARTAWDSPARSVRAAACSP